VIANFCRNGPGLSGISGSQVDYFQAVKGGGHGGYHLIVLAPRDAQEAVTLTYDAFDLADRYRNPVMIFCDGFIAQIIEAVSFPPYQGTEPMKPWAVTGRGTGPRRLLPNITSAREVPPALMAKYKRIMAEERRHQQIGTGKDVWLPLGQQRGSVRVSSKKHRTEASTSESSVRSRSFLFHRLN
jgi:2-oxoglutarate ferredoxin oxidoreductase subunit alpha